MEEKIEITSESSAEVRETIGIMPVAEMAPEIWKSLDTEAQGRMTLPAEARGSWSGAPGDSLFIPDPDAIYRFEGTDRSYADLLASWNNKHKKQVEGVGYFNGEPDFEPFEDEVIGHVTVNRMPTWRDEKKGGSYEAAENAFLETHKGWTRKSLRQYMKEHKLTWHECSDGHTIRAVPTEINAAFHHLGGIGTEKHREGLQKESGADLALDGVASPLADLAEQEVEEALAEAEAEGVDVTVTAVAEVEIEEFSEEVAAPECWHGYSPSIGLERMRALLAFGEWRGYDKAREPSPVPEWEGYAPAGEETRQGQERVRSNERG